MASAQTVTGTDKQANFLSGSGNPAGWGYFEGSKDARAVPEMPLPLALMPDNPQNWDATLKLADGLDGRTLPAGALSGLTIAQGHEDALNIANGAHHITVGGRLGVGAPGLRVITLKGVHDIAFEPDTTLESRGTQCEVKIGDWLDQTENASTGIDLSNLRHLDGGKIRVGANFRDQITSWGPNCVRAFWYSVGLTAYWWIKYLARKALRIPVGVSGPSFLP